MDLLRTDAYKFSLPKEQIAAYPRENRDSSRLLVLGEEFQDLRFSALAYLLKSDDLLVVNDAKVSPVRLFGNRLSGGKVEIFVLGFSQEGLWEENATKLTTLTRSNHRLRDGEEIKLQSGHHLRFEQRDSQSRAFFDTLGVSSKELIETFGKMPLPPYIEKRRKSLGETLEHPGDKERYQTRYARAQGAVAAPTAGLHFSDELLDTLKERKIQRASITLYVGAGTFKPITNARLTDHAMHSEYYEIPKATCKAILKTKERGGRIVAVGTTVVRTLEAATLQSQSKSQGKLKSGASKTDIFIYPGFNFQIVDAMITNFHLPSSTLIALVAAFGSYERVMSAYKHAVKKGYRFYSYGDAMFLPFKG